MTRPLTAAEHERRRDGRGDTSRVRPRLTVSAEGWEEALNLLGVRWRYNLRLDAREVDEGGDDRWERATASWLEHMAARVEAGFANSNGNPLKFGRDRLRHATLALDHRTKCDPFLDRLKGLEEEGAWDGVERLPSLLSDLFGAEKTDLHAWASTYPVLGAVERTFEPGKKMDAIPVLIGGQGIGKTTLVGRLAGDGYRELHSIDPKQAAEAVQGATIVEWSESLGMTRRELASIKAFLSRPDDGASVRKAFRPDPVPQPRRFTIVATTNDERPLPNDPTGNRRFVPVNLPGGEMEVGEIVRWLDEHWPLLWAEGVARMRKGETASLHGELERDARALQQAARSRDDLMEDAIVGAARDLAKLQGFVTVDEVHEALPVRVRSLLRSGHVIGATLRALGWTKDRIRRDGTRLKVWRAPDD